MRAPALYSAARKEFTPRRSQRPRRGEVANHLLRAGTSVGANIEEGQAAQSNADFISKYSIALPAILTSIIKKMRSKQK